MYNSEINRELERAYKDSRLDDALRLLYAANPGYFHLAMWDGGTQVCLDTYRRLGAVPPGEEQ